MSHTHTQSHTLDPVQSARPGLLQGPPDPVCAQHMASLPASATGIAKRWIGVGLMSAKLGV